MTEAWLRCKDKVGSMRSAVLVLFSVINYQCKPHIEERKPNFVCACLTNGVALPREKHN